MLTELYFFHLSGMIRLPKVAKSAIKNRPVPRPSLNNIVKELGELPIVYITGNPVCEDLPPLRL